MGRESRLGRGAGEGKGWRQHRQRSALLWLDSFDYMKVQSALLDSLKAKVHSRVSMED